MMNVTVMFIKHKYHYPVYVILAVAALLGAAAYFVPTASNTQLEHITAHRIRLVVTVIMTASFCGSAFLFLRGLGAFRAELQSAYRWFGAGNIGFGVAMLQWPVIVVAGLQSGFWAVSGIVIIPFLFATLLMYVGMRRFVLLLGVRSIMTSRLFSVSVAIACAVGSAVTAHMFASNNTAGIETETYTATVAWTTAYGILAWLLVRKVLHVIGPSYQGAMKWQSMALGMLVFGGIHECVTSYFLTEADWYIYGGVSMWPFVIVGFLFVWASHAMSLTRFAADQEPELASVSADDTRAFIDTILSMAALASRPDDIDDILDGLRGVTASMQPGAPLTEAHIGTLVSVYNQLEQYLTTSDPLRVFTHQELAAHVAPSVRQRLEQARSVAAEQQATA